MNTPCPSVSPQRSVDDLVDRVRGEYREMPGLRLTLLQAQRLFGLDPSACSIVFETLTRDRFLTRDRDGRFAPGADERPAVGAETSGRPLIAARRGRDHSMANTLSAAAGT